MENREIKCKLWFTGESRFVEPGAHNVYWNCQDGVLTAHIDTNGDWNELHIILFTDLRDKNGVEIFDGDILKLSDLIVEVTWFDGCWNIMMNVNQGRNPLTQDRARSFEVIGNRFEHPHLLNQEAK